jgi:putative flippase GtrA
VSLASRDSRAALDGRTTLNKRTTLWRQLVSFLLVGGVGLVIDIVVFNTLRTTVLSPASVAAGPVIAKTISTSLAIVANWVGNRFWTFKATRRGNVVREGVEFAVVSIAGSLIALGCLGISHYLLGLTTVLDDNIATNVIGLALGTVFRFALYRWWVFGDSRSGSGREQAEQGLTVRRAETGAGIPSLGGGETAVVSRDHVTESAGSAPVESGLQEA